LDFPGVFIASNPGRSFFSGGFDQTAIGYSFKFLRCLGRSGYLPHISCEMDFADDISYSLPGFQVI